MTINIAATFHFLLEIRFFVDFQIYKTCQKGGFSEYESSIHHSKKPTNVSLIILISLIYLCAL